MTPGRLAPPLALPRGWPKVVRCATLHAISLASAALTTAWGRAATARASRTRLVAEIDRLRAEIVMLREEQEIKDARWSRVPARRRPHYGPLQRMRILELRAARGWSTMQTAVRFLVIEETIASWIRRLDEEGQPALVHLGTACFDAEGLGSTIAASMLLGTMIPGSRSVDDEYEATVEALRQRFARLRGPVRKGLLTFEH